MTSQKPRFKLEDMDMQPARKAKISYRTGIAESSEVITERSHVCETIGCGCDRQCYCERDSCSCNGDCYSQSF